MYSGDRNGMGTLNLYLNVSNTTSLIWTQSGNKGDEWFNGQLSIKSAKSFRINIEAIRGATYRSDIAIDDIDFLERSCIIQPPEANPIQQQTTVAQLTSTRTVRPTAQYDCNFESDLCIWTNQAQNQFSWSRVQGTLGSQINGPIAFDHTLSSPEGWYIYASGEGRKKTDVAALETTVAISQTSCMEFYYYFTASTPFLFTVTTKQSAGSNFWSRSTSQGMLKLFLKSFFVSIQLYWCF
jgi:hypothetical protein